MKIPNIHSNTRITHHPDGSYSIPRAKKIVEAFLDEHLDRRGSELRWYPDLSEIPLLADMGKLYEGKMGYVIGRGPSLDHLQAGDFKDGCPIIALNDAFLKLETLDLDNPVFVIMQTEPHMKYKPKTYRVIIAEHLRHIYGISDKLLGMNLDDFVKDNNVRGAQKAIKILKDFGCVSLTLVAFDTETQKNTGVATCVKLPGQKGEVYVEDIKKVKNTAGSLGYMPTWYSPKPSLSSKPKITFDPEEAMKEEPPQIKDASDSDAT